MMIISILSYIDTWEPAEVSQLGSHNVVWSNIHYPT